MKTGSLANSCFKVLRYSALGAGVLYGFYHQRSLNAHFKMNDLTRKYQAEESLIAKAKAEYTKKTMPKESKTAGGDGKAPIPHYQCE